MRLTSLFATPVVACSTLVVLVLSSCAPAEESDPPASADPSASPTDGAAGGAAGCVTDDMLKNAGQLTIGTDSPAFEPWFAENDPTNAQGFESAVAYAVAERLGFEAGDVEWTKVRFNNTFKPGEKSFDFDINQISITPQREKAVDFSQGYYSASQAIFALEGSPVAEATSVADLADYTLGAQTGSTSLTVLRDVIAPTSDPLVFTDTNAAKQALSNGQVDGVLADLPTAFYITAVEIPKATIVGQFQPDGAEAEMFGMLLEKDSPLTECVDLAVTELREDGTLTDIEQEWLSDVVDVPVLQ